MGVAVRRSSRALAGLLAALAVEFADELVDGTKSAAMPLIKHDLALTYLQVGLLAAVPLILGSLIELPVGVLSGTGRRRLTTLRARVQTRRREARRARPVRRHRSPRESRANDPGGRHGNKITGTRRAMWVG